MSENKKDNVVPIGCISKLEAPIDKVLDGAKDKLDGALILGWDKNGMFYAASTFSDGGEILWLLKKAEQFLMEVGGEKD